ncbi:branched-subunit amino acid transport protein AzlD [Antricoccus suffuscus]|uniref:Branched-subunit amino acid transport protein AzlD n=1 Tax=Antricoccus suffuscus TaxID=1629062 RepID=A0A2T0ZW96_9ACTN|nr:AzlD domain-containing protein [Antricoccus suffuscus]PRZ40564.1 branched-subunit amino acid transport protein AzlD [Antricoccus suffuscus]
MTLWWWILGTSVLCFGTKCLGYVVPSKIMDNPRIAYMSGIVTIGLLAALTAANTVSSGQNVVFDARIGGLVAAAIALKLKAPFIVVVIVGAAATGVLRLI